MNPLKVRDIKTTKIYCISSDNSRYGGFIILLDTTYLLCGLLSQETAINHKPMVRIEISAYFTRVTYISRFGYFYAYVLWKSIQMRFHETHWQFAIIGHVMVVAALSKRYPLATKYRLIPRMRCHARFIAFDLICRFQIHIHTFVCLVRSCLFVTSTSGGGYHVILAGLLVFQFVFQFSENHRGTGLWTCFVTWIHVYYKHHGKICTNFSEIFSIDWTRHKERLSYFGALSELPYGYSF